MGRESPGGRGVMDFGKTWNTWQQAVADPNRFFSKLKAKPELSTAVKWAAIGGVVSVFLNQLALLINTRLDAAALVVGTLVSGAIITPLLLLVSSGILLLFAKLLGAKGSYAAQTYAMAAIQVPLSIAVAAVAFVFDILYAPTTFAYGMPVRTGMAGALYGFISFAITFYGLYAMVIAFRSVHKYSTMRAIATLLVPAVLLGIAAVLVVMFLTVAGYSAMAA